MDKASRDVGALAESVMAVLSEMPNRPPMYFTQGLACTPLQDRHALQLFGMTPALWTQLVNSAAMRIGQPYVTTSIVQTKYKQLLGADA